MVHFFFFDMVENIKGKEENDGYWHFFPFPTMFSRGFFFRVVGNVWLRVKNTAAKGETAFNMQFLIFIQFCMYQN